MQTNTSCLHKGKHFSTLVYKLYIKHTQAAREHLEQHNNKHEAAVTAPNSAL